ncbi:OLC1v1010384C1 [Oldenlandia corymbosa var. corymbosa]|uniref:OLC1v1010384C1 n=1 Tax=Oldenlandia corymbosa var. corymbosa TaxID=529605 RepID=A0AAV1DR72_OLDCO|nr:OLC1v1010384C1 [Oldenlandia corymbosa var. corymbosa]
MASMATTKLPIFLLSLSLIALTAYARPCKTLFFYTTTTSFYPATTASNAFSDSLNPNPNFDNVFAFEKSNSFSPKFLTFYLTTAKPHEDSRPRMSYISLRRTPFHLYYSNQADNFIGDVEENEAQEKRSDEDSMFPLGIYSSVSTSSIRDRTKDIMSVVGALLFGVGCGALTAATMFLIWSLFSPHRFEFDDSDDDSDDDDNDDEKRKVGYVTIPDEVDLIKMGIKAQKNGYVAIPEDVDMIKKGIAAQIKEAA